MAPTPRKAVPFTEVVPVGKASVIGLRKKAIEKVAPIDIVPDLVVGLTMVAVPIGLARAIKKMVLIGKAVPTKVVGLL